MKHERKVIYQIYPLSFKDSNQDGFGDLNGIIEKLDYLKTLGVDIIWLSPVYKSPMKDNGYDISDYLSINPQFGTMEDFKRLLKQAHDLGLKIIMDLVINHTSDKHVWFQEALKGRDNPFRDFYIWRDEKNDMESAFTGSAWEYVPLSNQYYFHLFTKEQPDLNWENYRLRQSIYKMINSWLDIGIDGFRLDVIDLIGKDVENKITYNGPNLIKYLKELKENCFQDDRLFTVGETPQVNIEMALTYRDIFDMVFHFEHFTLDEEVNQDKWHLKKLYLPDLKQVFNKWQQADVWNSLFWSNHDSPRIMSRFSSDLYNVKRGKMYATLLHFMRGTPYIYQGEEIGMTNVSFSNIEDYRDVETINIYKDKLNKGWTHKEVMDAIYKKSRDNARTPMQWDNSLYAGFSTVQPWISVNSNYTWLNVEENLQNPDSLFYYYQRLIKIRKEIDCISTGNFTLVDDKNEHLFAYKREDDLTVLFVVGNFYKEEIEINLPDKDYQVIIHNYDDFVYKPVLLLRPYECFVLLYQKK